MCSNQHRLLQLFPTKKPWFPSDIVAQTSRRSLKFFSKSFKKDLKHLKPHFFIFLWNKMPKTTQKKTAFFSTKTTVLGRCRRVGRARASHVCGAVRGRRRGAWESMGQGGALPWENPWGNRGGKEDDGGENSWENWWEKLEEQIYCKWRFGIWCDYVWMGKSSGQFRKMMENALQNILKFYELI